jgi:hypothetical protein
MIEITKHYNKKKYIFFKDVINLFDEKYLQPMSGQIDEIQKQKQQVDNEIERICLDVLNKKYDDIAKLSQHSMERLVYHIGEILIAYNCYIIYNKKESDIFKNIIDNIFTYILDNDCNLVNVMRQLKLHLSQVSKSMEGYVYNKEIFNLVSSWYSYLCDKESMIEKAKLRVEFMNTSDDFQELIYDMAEIEHVSEEAIKDLIETGFDSKLLSDIDYQIIENSTSYLFNEGSLGFTLKNFGVMIKNSSYNAQETGNFEALRPGLLKLVNRCKKVSDAQYLLRDTYSAKTQLHKLGENRPEIKKQCEKHIKWIEDVYKPAIQNKIKELKNKLNESSELLDEGLKDTIMKAKANIKVADRKTSGTIDSLADKIFGEIKATKDEDDRERIIRNSIPKASTIIKKALITGAVALINPAIALIGLLANLAINKHTTEIQRKLILKELQTEYKIVDEKIKDAESENDKKKKYELMRIHAKLERDIERIRYNLNY